MDQTLVIVVPVFAVIAIGYGVGRTRLFGQQGVKALTDFCFWVAIPGLLFRAMARLETPHGDALLVVAAFYAAVLATYAVAMGTGRVLFRMALPEQALFGSGATYSNILLLGLPLSITAFGEKAVLPASALLAFQSPVLITVTALVVEIGRGRKGAVGKVLVSAAVALATTPVVVAMLAGLAWGATGLGLHPIVDKTLGYLGQAATPTALFALGASLTRFRLGGDLGEVAAMVVLKLALLPAACFASAHWLFGLDTLYVAIATICGAMPTGVTAFVLAMRYEMQVARIAASVIVTAAISWAMAAALLAWFLPRVG